MAVTQDAVLEKLKNVIDPELFVNIVDLGLIYEVKLNPDQSTESDEPQAAQVETSDQLAAQEEDQAAPEQQAPDQQVTEQQDAGQQDVDSPPAAADGDGLRVHIDMTMTSPACPAGPQLIEGAKREVNGLEGVDHVEVRIVLDPPWTPDRMTEDAKDQLGIF